MILEEKDEEIKFEPYEDSELRANDNLGMSTTEQSNDKAQEIINEFQSTSPGTASGTLIADQSTLSRRSQRTSHRKRVSKSPGREQMKNAKYRERGQEYSGYKKMKSNIDGSSRSKYKVLKPARQLKEPCSCELSLKEDAGIKCRTFTQEDREKLFNEFWQLSWVEKKTLVCSLIHMTTTERKRNRKDRDDTRRTYSFIYHLPLGEQKIRVCKTMFVNTLNLGRWSVQTWKTGQNDIISPPKNKKMKSVAISKQKEDCRRFLQNLAKLESDRYRLDSSKLYLEPLWSSLNELYRTYVATINEKNEVPLPQCNFSEIFHNLNLKIFKSRKHECDVCTSYRKNIVPEEEYQLHRLAIEETCTEKELDKSTAQHKVFAVGVQSVLLSPRNNSSDMYYKTKLFVHNYTICNLQTNEVWCYIWNETDGALSESNFASVLCHFFSSYGFVPGDIIILFTDGCEYQHKNVQLTNAFINLAMEKNITVVQKFLIKGHSQTEVDSVHSTIEQKIKSREVPINVPADYVWLIKEARHRSPFNVNYLDYRFFKSFDQLQFMSSVCLPEEATIANIQALKYLPSGEAFYKFQFQDHYLPLNRVEVKLEIPQKSIPFEELPQAYSEKLKITKSKFDHLQSLKTTILPDYHSFYDNLPHSVE